MDHPKQELTAKGLSFGDCLDGRHCCSIRLRERLHLARSRWGSTGLRGLGPAIHARALRDRDSLPLIEGQM
jgi:hypothetical protein